MSTCAAYSLLTLISPFEIDKDGHWTAKMCGGRVCITLLIMDMIMVGVLDKISCSVCITGLSSTCVGFYIVGALYARSVM